MRTTQVSFPELYDTTAAAYTNMNSVELNEYQVSASASKVDCPEKGGCTFTYHFIRPFNADIEIEAGTERMYDFYAFYDISGDRAFSKPYQLALGGFYSLAATSVATAAALLMLTI